jgi:peptidoglycan/LPS O-acetylase OafA/YrhL
VAEQIAGQRTKLQSVEALRGIAAMCVVFFHANQFEMDPRYFGHPPMGGFWAWGLHGVDLFFVISGFIIAHVHFRDFLGGTGWKRFLVSRITRVYVPYWPVLAVLAIVYFAMPTLGVGAESTVRDPLTILRSALLWPGRHGLLPPAWTLQHEVVFYLVVMIALMRPAIGILLIVLWQFYAIAVGLTASGDSESAKLWLGPYEIEFALGIACMLILRRFPVARYPRTMLAMGTGAFLAIALYTTYVRDFTPVSFAGTMSYGLAASLILLGAVYSERMGCLPVPRMAVFLGAASYSIYLIHFPLISVLTKLLGRSGIIHSWSADLILLELAVACVAAGCLYHVLVERKLIEASRGMLVGAIGADSDRPRRRPAEGAAGAIVALWK